MSLNRRQLLQLAGVSALFHSCHFLKKTQSETIVIPRKETIYSGFRDGAAYVSENAGIHIGSQNQNIRTKLSKEVHSGIYSEANGFMFFIAKLEVESYAQIEKNGPLIPFHAEENHYFYGHGAFDEKRKILYTTQAAITADRSEGKRANQEGYIFVYSVPEMKIIDKFKTFGRDPHDMKIVEDVLVICNGGFDSNVTFIDIQTRKLLGDYHVNVDHLSMRHIDVIDKKNFLVASMSVDLNQPCPLYLLNIDTGFKAFVPPENLAMTLMRVQLLSVLHHDGYAYATCPFKDVVLVFKTTGEYVGAHQIPGASNIAYSNELKGVIVGNGDVKQCARLVRIENGNLKVSSIGWARGITGSHSLLVST